MLLQLSHFFPPLYSPPPCTQLPISIPPPQCIFMGIHLSSLASPFPILFLTSPYLFCTYHLCFLFPVPVPPFVPLYLPTDNLPCDLHFCDSVPVRVVCLVSLFFQVQLLIVVSLLSFHCSYFWSSSFSQISAFNISYNKGLVMMNSFNLTLSGKHFICPSILNDSYAGQSNLGWKSLPFLTLNTSFQPLLACKVSFEKSAASLMGTPLQVTISFSLAAFKILSLSLILGDLIMMCLGVCFLGYNFFGTL